MSSADSREHRLSAIRESITYGKAQHARMREELDLYEKDLEKILQTVEDMKRKIAENKQKSVPDMMEHSKLCSRLTRRTGDIETVKASIESTEKTIESVSNRIKELEFERDMLEKEIIKWGRVYEFKVNGR